MKLEKYQLSEKSLNKVRGGCWGWVGSAIISGLVAIYDDPDDFIDGFKSGAK